MQWHSRFPSAPGSLSHGAEPTKGAWKGHISCSRTVNLVKEKGENLTKINKHLLSPYNAKQTYNNITDRTMPLVSVCISLHFLLVSLSFQWHLIKHVKQHGSLLVMLLVFPSVTLLIHNHLQALSFKKDNVAFKSDRWSGAAVSQIGSQQIVVAFVSWRAPVPQLCAWILRCFMLLWKPHCSHKTSINSITGCL